MKHTSDSRKSSRRRTAIRLAAAGGTVGVVVIGFWDEIKHGYAAAERSARVATTLAICINEYVSLNCVKRTDLIPFFA